MKVIRKKNNTPCGSSLYITLLLGIGDIKSSLIQISKRIGKNRSISITKLKQLLFETATDDHMPQEPRIYIVDWMINRAIVMGFVFRTDDYIGNGCTSPDMYMIDEELIRGKKRGRKPQKINPVCKD